MAVASKAELSTSFLTLVIAASRIERSVRGSRDTIDIICKKTVLAWSVEDRTEDTGDGITNNERTTKSAEGEFRKEQTNGGNERRIRVFDSDVRRRNANSDRKRRRRLRLNTINPRSNAACARAVNYQLSAYRRENTRRSGRFQVQLCLSASFHDQKSAIMLNANRRYNDNIMNYSVNINNKYADFVCSNGEIEIQTNFEICKL